MTIEGLPKQKEPEQDSEVRARSVHPQTCQPLIRLKSRVGGEGVRLWGSKAGRGDRDQSKRPCDAG